MESRNDDVPSVGRSNDDYITNTFYSAKLGLSNFFRLGRDWDETGTRDWDERGKVWRESITNAGAVPNGYHRQPSSARRAER